MKKSIKKTLNRNLYFNKKDKTTTPLESFIKKHTSAVNKLLSVKSSDKNYIISFGADCRNYLLDTNERLIKKSDLKLVDSGHFLSESPVLDALSLNPDTSLIASQRDIYFVDNQRFLELMIETSEQTFNLSTKNRRSVKQDTSMMILSVDFARKHLD